MHMVYHFPGTLENTQEEEEEEDGVMPTRYFSRAQAHTSSGGSADTGTPPLILFLLTCEKCVLKENRVIGGVI